MPSEVRLNALTPLPCYGVSKGGREGFVRGVLSYPYDVIYLHARGGITH